MEFLVIRKKNYLKNFPSSATAYFCILEPNLIYWFELRRWTYIFLYIWWLKNLSQKSKP